MSGSVAILLRLACHPEPDCLMHQRHCNLCPYIKTRFWGVPIRNVPSNKGCDMHAWLCVAGCSVPVQVGTGKQCCASGTCLAPTLGSNPPSGTCNSPDSPDCIAADGSCASGAQCTSPRFDIPGQCTSSGACGETMPYIQPMFCPCALFQYASDCSAPLTKPSCLRTRAL